MANASNILESALLNHVFRTTTLAQPTNTYVGLHSADPTDAATGAELSGGNYARVTVPRADASWTAPAAAGAGGRSISNNIAVTFVAPNAAWGTATHWALHSASTGTGSFWLYSSLVSSRTINSGDAAPSFAVGQLPIRWTGWSTYLTDALLNHLLRTTALTKPASTWISLHTGDPGATGANEVTGGSYTRVQVTSADANWSAPADDGGPQKVTNSAVITFAAPTATWGLITYVGVWSLQTGGNFYMGGALSSSRTISSGDPAPSFPAGSVAPRLA